MAWSQPLKNEKISSSVPNVTLRLICRKGTQPRMIVSVTKALYAKMGMPGRADVMFGTGEHEGMMRVAFNREGEFAFSNRGKGEKIDGASLQLPRPPLAPAGLHANGIRCEFEASEEELIVTLPVADWRAAAAKPSRQRAA